MTKQQQHIPSMAVSASVFRVSDGIRDNIIEKDLENSTSLFVNETRNMLDTNRTSETTDSGLGDSLDIVTKDLAMTLGASLSESLSSFATARHVSICFVCLLICAWLRFVSRLSLVLSEAMTSTRKSEPFVPG
jgi:hypothetical protein